ncbi:MAG: hypothetical protein ABIA77_01745 [Candidatus Omnitrophota bacterium]
MNNEKLKGHPIYELFRKHISWHSAILNETEYVEEIKELCEERNKDAHPKDYDANQRAKYYLLVRNAVLGTEKREGLLARLARSREMSE